MSVFEDLQQMHDFYGFERNEVPSFLTAKHQDARTEFIQEEVNELNSAIEANDLPEAVDALIDIIVVAVGTLDLMGCESVKHWDEVFFCNMAKKVGRQKKREGMQFDLIKPSGWVPPNHITILKNGGSDG